MKRIAILILTISIVLGTCSCNIFRPRGVVRPMVRTTTTTTSGGMGLEAMSGPSQVTVTETPYESPAYTASGAAMFSRR